MNKLETTIVYWGYLGIMEKKMETTVHSRRLAAGFLCLLALMYGTFALSLAHLPAWMLHGGRTKAGMS